MAEPSEQINETEETPEPSVRANPLGGTAAFDYLTDLLIPLCILGMVAAFTYFLIELRAAYLAGGNQLLKYVFAWFLVAVVCISRLRAKYGGEVVAAPYAIALGMVMALFVVRFGALAGSGQASGALLMLSIVALAWWAIHRLTDECTVEEERADESEEGLLSSFRRRSANGERRRRHPGRQVIVLGIAALCVFAFSQPAVEHSGPEVARRAFGYMVAYLLFTLLLLALTSLSGLKLYVRRRGATFDRGLSPAWLVASAAATAAILGLAALMPRVVDSGGELIVRRVNEGFGVSPQELPVDSPVEGVRTPDGGRVLGKSGEGDGRVGEGDTARGTSAGQGATGDRSASAGTGSSGQGEGSRPGKGEGKGAGKAEEPTAEEAEQRRSADDPGAKEGASPAEPNEDQQQPSGERRAQSPNAQGRESPTEQRDTPGTAPPATPDTEKSGEPGATQETPSPDSPGSEETRSQDEGPRSSEPEASGADQPAASPPPSPAGPPPDLRLLLWVGIAVGALAVLYALARLIPAFGRFLRKLVNLRLDLLSPARALLGRLSQFWRRLFKRGEAIDDDPAAALPSDPLTNPFADRSLLERLSPSLVVEHSYHALLRYAELKGCQRRKDQTPLEFLRGLPEGLCEVKDEFTVVTRLYIEAAYTGAELPVAAVEQVRPVWDRLEGLVQALRK